jgi:hypothetical protein
MKSVMGAAAAMAVAVAGTGAGLAVAHPGQGQAHGKGHGQGSLHRADRPCVDRPAPIVGYVFRGRVVAATPEAVTVNLSGGNRHARRALESATPSIRISRTASTDLLRVPVTLGASVTRNGAATAPLVGDHAVVVYRAPMSKTVGRRCAAVGQLAVTVSGDPAAATIGGTRATLVRVAAHAPA